MTRSGAARAAARSVTAGDRTFNLLILNTGAVPEPRAEGNKVVLGGQTITSDGSKITLGKFTPHSQAAAARLAGAESENRD